MGLSLVKSMVIVSPELISKKKLQSMTVFMSITLVNKNLL